MFRRLTLTGVLLLQSAGCATPGSVAPHVDEPATARVAAGDLAPLAGPWQGALTYRDYGSGELTTIAVRASGDVGEGGAVTLHISYPDEPGHEEARDLTVGPDGRTLGGLPVVERSPLPDGGVRVVTEERGVDGNDERPATFRHLLEVRADSLVLAKHVRFDGTREPFERHAYRLSR